MRRAALFATAIVLVAAAGVGGQQPPARDPQVRDPQVRDPQGRKPTGTGGLSGRIVSDESSPQPVRRARVFVSSADMTTSKSIYTDESGRFAIDGLPANRYTLQATKAGWVRATYGAKRPDRPGTPITLGDGQHMTDIVLRMVKGGVITGTITDDHGLPAFGAQVRVLQYRTQAGERILAPVPTGSPFGETTDDRGMYRLFGLSPGEYVVTASPRIALTGEVRAMTDAEIRAALQALQQPKEALPPGGTQAAQPAPVRDEGTTVSYTQVFYPGTTVAANASTITLGPGEERSGVDFQLQLVRTAKIEGTIAGPAGLPLQSVQMMLVPKGDGAATLSAGPAMLQRASPTSEGRFSYTAVPPGLYTITARAPRPGGQGPGAAGGDTFRFTSSLNAGEEFTVINSGGGSAYWAQADVAVDGQKITDLSLTLQPGMRISGKIEFRGTRAIPPADLTRVRVSLMPAAGPGLSNVAVGLPNAQVDASGRFTFDGVTPGRYRMNATAPAAPGSGPGLWRLKSAMVKGRDALDFPLEIAPNEEIADAVLTFTDATQEVAGSLQDRSGRPAPDYTIIVFPSDKQYWTVTRRIRTAQPGTDGRFTVSGLPAGDYRIAAAVDVSPSDVTDPAFLEQLVAASYQFALAEGEKKVQNLQIAGGG